MGSLLSPEPELSLGLLPHAATARSTAAPVATARRVVPDQPRRARFPGLCFAIEAPVPVELSQSFATRGAHRVWWGSHVSSNSPITGPPLLVGGTFRHIRPTCPCGRTARDGTQRPAAPTVSRRALATGPRLIGGYGEGGPAAARDRWCSKRLRSTL